MCYGSFKDSYEQCTDGYVLLRAVYDTHGLFTSYLRIYQSVDNRKKIFDMSKICLSFHGCLRVFPSYLRIPASYLPMLAIDYELAIRKDS